MPAVEPSTQSRRVWPTISMIVGTPRPGSPTSSAQAPSSSISLDALLRLPSLSLRRWMRSALRSPSGVIRGSAKQLRPSAVWASTRKRSLMGALQNHLWPVRRYAPSAGSATVVFARTSEPPCFSVIAMPQIADALPGRSSGSYAVASSRGSHAAATAGAWRRAGIAENVIEIGQPWPGSDRESVMNSAARATCAPGTGSRQGSAWSSCSTASAMKRW